MHEIISNNLARNFEEKSKTEYLYYVSVGSVSSVKVAPKGH